MTPRVSSSWPAVLTLAVFACANGPADSAAQANASSTPPAADAAAFDAAADVAADAAPPVPGVPRYSVPVTSKDLEPWSYYAVTGAHGEVRRGTLKLEYVFPVFLTGTPDVVVALEGPYAPGATHVVVTAGPYGTGACDLVGDNWSCREELPGITVDVAAARAAMQAANLAPAEIERKLEVTESFSVDPIGIFEMRAADIDDRGDDD